MNHDRVDNGSLSTKNHDGAANLPGPVNPNYADFARRLRALGQALEKFGFSAFDIELGSGNYLVTGRATAAESVKFSVLRRIREWLCGPQVGLASGDAGQRVKLRFSSDEIENFDRRGKVKRRDPSQMPDPYSISQILRGAGSYLDNREVTALVAISLNGKWVTLRYESSPGRLEQAKQDLEYFYDYWVKMYLRRSNRPRLSAVSDPTLFVTWEGMRRVHSL